MLYLDVIYLTIFRISEYSKDVSNGFSIPESSVNRLTHTVDGWPHGGSVTGNVRSGPKWPT